MASNVVAANQEVILDLSPTASSEGLQYYKTKELPLGSGAFGTVYQVCRPSNPDDEFAVKLIDMEAMKDKIDEDIKRGVFERLAADEARKMSIVSGHPNVVEIIQAYHDPSSNTYILEFELCTGGTMQQEILRHVSCSKYFYFGDLRRWSYQLASALDHIHTRGIIHRDIKSDNILFATTSKQDIKLGDFGLAKFQDLPSYSAELQAPVSPVMSLTPECRSGRHKSDYYTAEMDCWCFGHILYHWVELRFLEAYDLWQCDESPSFENPNVPTELRRLIQVQLHWEPSERLSSGRMLTHPWFAEEADTSFWQSHKAVLQNAVVEGNLGNVQATVEVLRGKFALNFLKKPLDLPGKDLYSSIHWAAGRYGNIDIVKLLLEIKDVFLLEDESQQLKRTPLMVAAMYGHVGILDWLIKRGANLDKKSDEDKDNGQTALHFAARNGHLEAVQYLLEEAPDKSSLLRARNSHRETPLMQAIRGSHVNVIKELLTTYQETSSSTIHLAAKCANAETIKTILQHAGNAQVVKNVVNSMHNGKSPLMLAARANRNEDVFRALVDAGADRNATTSRGEKPIDIFDKYSATITDEIARSKLRKLIKPKGWIFSRKPSQ